MRVVDNASKRETFEHPFPSREEWGGEMGTLVGGTTLFKWETELGVRRPKLTILLSLPPFFRTFSFLSGRHEFGAR